MNSPIILKIDNNVYEYITLIPVIVIKIVEFHKDQNNCKVVLYVDDTLLLYAHKDENEIKKVLDYDLENVAKWFDLNVKKT